jgi:hypothetical protein
VTFVIVRLDGRNGTIKNIRMASTGVLPFVRGVDFTSNDFSVSLFTVLNKLYHKIHTMIFDIFDVLLYTQ